MKDYAAIADMIRIFDATTVNQDFIFSRNGGEVDRRQALEDDLLWIRGEVK